MPDSETANTPWSESELRACVVAYHRLWTAQTEGASLGKASLRREALANSIRGRSDGAYEFRMQNISAVLEELGVARVSGYLPRHNVGAPKLLLLRLIDEVWERHSEQEAATADPEKLETRILAARLKLRRRASTSAYPPPPGDRAPPRFRRSTSCFIRDPNVICWVLETASGSCEVCRSPAPFFGRDGEPYLEVHHVRQLAEGGPDAVDNAVACCPNCHRRLHSGSDREKLRQALLVDVQRLIDYPRGPVVELTDVV